MNDISKSLLTVNKAYHFGTAYYKPDYDFQPLNSFMEPPNDIIAHYVYLALSDKDPVSVEFLLNGIENKSGKTINWSIAKSRACELIREYVSENWYKDLTAITGMNHTKAKQAENKGIINNLFTIKTLMAFDREFLNHLIKNVN